MTMESSHDSHAFCGRIGLVSGPGGPSRYKPLPASSRAFFRNKVGLQEVLMRNAQVGCAVPFLGSWCCYSRVIASFSGTLTRLYLKSTVLVFGVAVVLVLGAKVALPWCETSPVRSDYSVSASADRSIALTGYDHIEPGSICASDMSAAAVLPRIAPLAGSDFITMAGIAVAGWLAAMLSPMMRAPPGRLAASLTGRQILSRLCISRR
ncbi:hypothetical protein [Mycobacterium sp. 29Ha]|uniref:hypothetical protein n=1 Tax=Mycobacterium sp. 29Ha TaxID=2939268 RepID=UPI0029392613|nr:hypothetical protein [Mycobacterium sp. 29Ha]MDV3131935.1 hypothetical protein [Mycobacterium sp. 29Ha]